MKPFGPRASIDRIGVCEQLPNGSWWLSGWAFDGRSDPSVHGLSRDSDGNLLIAGWRMDDLRGVSEAQWELSALPTHSERS